MTEVRLKSPYLADKGAMWLKGSLHTHTTRSDGSLAPQEMIRQYAARGYDFLALSDHDVFAELEGLDPCGMVLIRAAELTIDSSHLLVIDFREPFVKPDQHQSAIDAVVAQGGLAVLSHPNWGGLFNHHPYGRLLKLSGYAGIEICNGSAVVNPGSHLALDKWDRLLGAGRTVWGFANDDAHHDYEIGRVWNMVRARERSREGILEALRTGSFYASSGVVVETVGCEGPEVNIVTANADRIVITGDTGQRLCAVDSGKLRFDVTDVPFRYVRAECYGRGEQVAWLQPMLIRGGVFERLSGVAAGEKPPLKVLRADRAPKLTGKMDDPLWQRGDGSARFLSIKDGSAPPVRTEVRSIAAEGKLFLAVRCEEPKLDELRIQGSADHDTRIGADDSVEVFLDPRGDAVNYWQIIVNAAGFAVAYARGEDEQIRPHVKVMSHRGQGGWSVELAIPLAELGGVTEPGSRWGLHFCRNRHPAPAGTYVWSWVGKTNHNPSHFGTLAF